MTQEDKELLLKDLCTRLPYDVKVLYDNKVFNIDYVSSIYKEIKLDTCDKYTLDISDVKPILSGIFTPGSFSLCSLMLRILSTSLSKADHIVTLCPASAAIIAILIPKAPAPNITIFDISCSPHC